MEFKYLKNLYDLNLIQDISVIPADSGWNIKFTLKTQEVVYPFKARTSDVKVYKTLIGVHSDLQSLGVDNVNWVINKSD